MVISSKRETKMVKQVHFDASAQLFENKSGDLAIRFANNSVFEYSSSNLGEGFVSDAMNMLNQGKRRSDWRMIPYRKLFHDDQNWHLISSMGFLDGDETRPALLLEVNPDQLGVLARKYLKTDLPKTLQ